MAEDDYSCQRRDTFASQFFNSRDFSPAVTQIFSYRAFAIHIPNVITSGNVAIHRTIAPRMQQRILAVTTFGNRTRTHPHLSSAVSVTALGVMLALAAPASAQVAPADRLCDVSYEDCRATILQMIRTETAGIDVSYWFMTDWRYSTEIIKRWQAGVPVRIITDLRSDPNYPAGASIRQSFVTAGIPVRHKVTTGINHWKMMLYRGQNAVHFSAANFANGSYSPSEVGGEYRTYVDEAIYFTTDPLVVQTFMRKYDDIWTDTSNYQNLANVSTPLTRNYPMYTGNQLDPALNFPPDEDYQDRLIAAMKNETQQVDVVMFRITSGKVPDEMIRRVQAGVPVRLITDRRQYRNTTYFWDSYNVDRMYMAGIPIKVKDNGTDQDVHQKSVVLHGVDMAVFGSSNWTAASSDTQREHNYFTGKDWFVQWFKDQFLRKWNNTRADGTPITPAQYVPYTPGWPETPVNVSPSNNALSTATTVVLKWEGGWWAHKYDIYFGTTNPPPLVAQNFMPGSATAGVMSAKESFNPCAPPAPFVSACPSGLTPGTTYYWKIRGKTMIGDGGGPFNAPARAINGPIWSFTTSGAAPSQSAEQARILGDAYVRGGQYADTNFGKAVDLIAKFSADTAYLREAYMLLDISTVQPGQTVRLRLFGKLSDTRAPSVTTTIVPLATNAWTETSVTWNNKPAAGSDLWGTVAVSGTTGQWYDVDITSKVQALRTAGQTTVGIALRCGVDTLPYAGFGSRESGNAPQLVITP
jgi:phosphatidylserine/phosphatidylglycerophosphate/cardiolipin synthase-like enzyme